MKYDAESIKNRKSINNRIKKIVFIFIIILLYNITLISVSYIDKFETPSIYKYKAYIISTTSMEPAIKENDVVIIEKCEESDLHVDDIITFKLNNEVITHRIVNILDNEDNTHQYVTKGDNNNIEDDKNLNIDDIEGKVVIVIPFLGKIAKVLKNGIVIVLIILIILISYLNNIESKEKSEYRREKKKIEDKKFMDK